MRSTPQSPSKGRARMENTELFGIGRATARQETPYVMGPVTLVSAREEGGGFGRYT